MIIGIKKMTDMNTSFTFMFFLKYLLGDYGKVWNSFYLNEKQYIVDLMHNPGSILDIESSEAKRYISFGWNPYILCNIFLLYCNCIPSTIYFLNNKYFYNNMFCILSAWIFTVENGRNQTIVGFLMSSGLFSGRHWSPHST